MHIPEKYCERYDNLARSHPWMREMRDETRTVGDLISQRTEEIEERNLLIAKARNSFKSIADNVFDIDRMRKACRTAVDRMDVDMERMGIALDGESIEMTNGIGVETNGIAEDSPLVDGDVVAILRKAASYDGDYSGSNEALRRLTGTTTVPYALEALADMVERDYVSRETHGKAADIWQAASDEWRKRALKAEGERDEWKAKAEKYLSDSKLSL